MLSGGLYLTYFYVGCLLASLIAGMACSHWLQHRWGHLPWLKLRVAGLSVLLVTVVCLIPALWFYAAFVIAFLAWLNLGLAWDTLRRFSR